MQKLTFSLQQHTPLIQFHEQPGAGLRSTEVKPKLDKYLISKLQMISLKQDGSRTINPGYETMFNDLKAFSLDYKMAINVGLIKDKFSVTIIPPNRDLGNIYVSTIITIKSFNIALLRVIDTNLKSFFIEHNFGKRASKGFGCFYVEGTKINDIRNCSRIVYKYHGTDFKNSGLNFHQKITKLWRVLKSGQNYPYKKSRVFKYMYNGEMRWDKRYFKGYIFDLINAPINTNTEFQIPLEYKNNKPLDVSKLEEDEGPDGYYSFEDNTDFNDNYFFGRALLGLAEHYEFQTKSSDRVYKVVVKSDLIKRFKSPITFKIFENNIYAILEHIPNDMFNATFSFDLEVKNPINKTTIDKIDNYPPPLPTPSNLKFILEDFARTEFKYINFHLIS